jgi:Asp-tRNA(Asn)/Glu-tRNA(Gln) amidotransferase C subunit
MITETIFEQLANLSKIDFYSENSEKGQVKFIEDLNLIVNFVAKATEFDENKFASYDDTLENNSVSFSQLRDDVEISTASPEKLLANTNSENNCYIIPRVID